MSKKYKLILDNFGKFKNTTYEFGDVTVFYGPNEVGKTTIIDALSNGLVKVLKNQSLYKQVLEPRYGETFSSKLKKIETGEEFKKIDHDLVRNLLIVRASNLSLEFVLKDKELSWVDDLKNKLFAGGVNPQTLIALIEKIETKDKNKSHLNPEIIKNKAEIDKKRGEIQKIQAQIKEGENNLKDQRHLMKQELELTAQLNSLADEINKRKGKIDQDKKFIEKKKVLEISLIINEKKELLEELKKSSFLNEDEYNEIKSLESSIEKLKIKISDQNNQIKDKTVAKDKLDEARKELEPAFNKSIYLIDKITETKQNVLALIPTKEEEQFELNKAFLLTGIITIVLGILIFALPIEVSIIFPILLAIAGFILLLFSYLKRSTYKATNHILENIIQGFNNFYTDNPKCPNAAIPEVVQFLDKLLGELSSQNVNYNNIINQISNLEKEIGGILEENSKQKAQEQRQTEELKSKLPHGLKTSEEFYKLLTYKNQKNKQLTEVKEKISKHVSEYGFTTEEELVVFLNPKILELSVIQSPVEVISLVEFNNLEKELQNKENEEKRIYNELVKVKYELGVKKNTFDLKFGTLNANQIELEKQIRSLEDINEKLSIQLDSFKELKKIISELSDDVTEKFAALSDNINFYLKIILDQERKITFSKLNTLEHIDCTDFYGNTVNALQLSSGTRDAFVLAARLALLEKLDLADNALLMLDDPFVLMDSERQSRGIEAIKTFYERTKMPIVFFTKDEQLKKQIFISFSEVLENPLERSHP